MVRESGEKRMFVQELKGKNNNNNFKEMKAGDFGFVLVHFIHPSKMRRNICLCVFFFG